MTETTTRKPRGRERKTKPQAATWRVGHMEATTEGDWFILRAGKSLILRTQSEAQFQEYCRLIETTR